MPDGMKPPKTIEEVGIHLVYMFKAQNDTNESLKKVETTLDSMQSTAVQRVEFDEHVLWGQTNLKELDARVKVLENDKAIDDSSIWENFKKNAVDYIVKATVVAAIVGIFYVIVKTSTIDISDLMK